MNETTVTNGKIDINVGGIAFVGEGNQEWLTQQLDKILAAATDLAKNQPSSVSPVLQNAVGVQVPSGSPEAVGTLAAYIRLKAGDGNQVRRFLATADWLRRRGEKSLAANKVAKALADGQQKRLANPADCLNKLVAKGFCEKTGDGGFYITPDGLQDLGISE